MDTLFNIFWEEYNKDCHYGLPIFSEDDKILAKDVFDIQQEEIERLKVEIKQLEAEAERR